MLKSIGDFAVNIIPTVDQGKFNKGVQFLGNLGNTTKLIDFGMKLGKAFTGILTDTAEATSEMYLFAKSLDLPIGKVEQLRRAFVLSGTSADVADSAMQGLLKTVQGFKYGEGNFEMLGKAGITPQMFSGNPLKDIEMLGGRFSKMNAAQRQYFISGAGLSPDALRYLSLETKERQRILTLAQSTGLATEKQGKDSFQFMQNMSATKQQYESFKRTLVSETLPDVSKTMKSLSELLQDKEFLTAVKDLSIAISKLAEILAGGLGDAIKGFAMFTKPLETGKEALSGVKSMLWGGYNMAKPISALKGSMSGGTSNKTTTINVNANGMGTKEAADMIADKVKSTLKDENKNQIDMQQKIYNY